MNNELFEFEINDDNITITKYIGNQADVVIPAEIDGKPVTKIGRKAFADCVFLATVVLPDEQMEVAEDAFDNCPNAEFFVADPDWDSESTQTSNELNSSDNNDSASENMTFDFDFAKKTEQNPNEPKYRMSLNRSKLVRDDFRQPFSSDQILFPNKIKGTLSKTTDSLFANLLAVLFYSLIVFLGTLLLASAASGLISFVTAAAFPPTNTRTIYLSDSADFYLSDNQQVFSFSLLISSLLILGAFLTGFIRIIFAMTLKRPYSWKLLFSGFDYSLWKTTIMWVLFYANVLFGCFVIALSIEGHNSPQYTTLPVLLLNIPIAFFLIGTIVILACKRIGIFEAMSLVSKYSVSEFNNFILPNVLAFLYAFVAMLIGGLFIYLFDAGYKHIFLTKFSPFTPGEIFLVPMIWCLPILFYYAAFFVKICPNILDNNLSESVIYESEK